MVWEEEKLALVKDDGGKGKFSLGGWYLVHASPPFRIASSFYPQNRGGEVSRVAWGTADLR